MTDLLVIKIGYVGQCEAGYVWLACSGTGGATARHTAHVLAGSRLRHQPNTRLWLEYTNMPGLKTPSGAGPCHESKKIRMSPSLRRTMDAPQISFTEFAICHHYTFKQLATQSSSPCAKPVIITTCNLLVVTCDFVIVTCNIITFVEFVLMSPATSIVNDICFAGLQTSVY